MTAWQTLAVASDGPVTILTITREAQRNALSSQVLSELAQAAAALEADASVRVVILTGAGDKAFVAGADISEMAEMSPSAAHAFAERGGALGSAIENSRLPWIAMVNGVALGGGCELALACDFIVASAQALFGQPEVKLGVIPGFGGTQRLARRVGIAKAKELCLVGDPIDAAEALRIGLVDRMVPAAELAAHCGELARKIAKNAPLAVASAKRLIHAGQSVPLEAALALEQQAFALLFATADQREGMAAFVARPRREPVFVSR